MSNKIDMFTGIVEGVGKVISLDEEEQSWCFKLDLPSRIVMVWNPGLVGCKRVLSDI